MKFKNIIAAATSAVIVGAASSASATSVSIGFEAATTGFVNQSFVEDGYTVDAAGGAYFQLDDGTDGRMEYERAAGSAGTLAISRASVFSFSSLDWQLEYGSKASVSIEGFLGASSVGIDTFSTDSLSYKTFSAFNLLGKTLDKLIISAERSSNGGSLDAVVLSDAVAPVPVPAAGLMLLGGLGGLTALRRRKKTA